jgi:ribonucleoside-diphosphate reductase beta chain
MSVIVDLSAFDVNKRRLIEGPHSDLMAVSPLKHAWARDVWKVMLANTWMAQEIDLSRDVKQYKELTDAERLMYDRDLAFLSNLDGIQFNNLTLNIGSHITSPEVSMCISRQSWEEANHVDAYSTMIEAVSLNPMELYTMFARDNVLADKNEYIMKQSAILSNEYSAENFALAVVANIILEGVYFYSGFLGFYTLAKMGKMLGSTDMIRLIQRDEEVHLHLFVQMFKTLQIERPELFTSAFYEKTAVLFDEAAKLETRWGSYIIEGGVLGLTESIIKQYIQYLVDKRLALIGLPALYQVKNPVPWVEKFATVNGVEQNFFEAKVSSYSLGTLAW